MSRPLPYGRQDVSTLDIEAVDDRLRSDFLTQGPKVAELEAALCAATGALHAVAVSHGTAALHLCSLGVGLTAGDTAIVPAMTFVATANAVRYTGAEVAFADVDPRTGLVDVEAVEATAQKLATQGRGPKAITAVDFAGQPADWSALRSIADRHGAKLIADAAHSLGGEERSGERSHRVGGGPYPEVTALSFHPVKAITTGEGGAVLCGDPKLADRLRRLRSHGIDKNPKAIDPDDPLKGPWYSEQHELGFNYRLTDLQCALGISQLTRLPTFLARRAELAARYREALAQPPLAGRLRPLASLPNRTHANHLFVVQIDGPPDIPALARSRKRLFLFLQKEDIQPQVHYLPVPDHPYYRARLPAGASFPGAEEYYARSLSLPLFPSMSDADQGRVIDALTRWCQER